jgi:hypothetical protein
VVAGVSFYCCPSSPGMWRIYKLLIPGGGGGGGVGGREMVKFRFIISAGGKIPNHSDL